MIDFIKIDEVLIMYIDPNLPLPDNTKADYHECLAKIILETLFEDEFKNLGIDCERPDLQNEEMSIGVEVTISENTKQKEAEGLYSKVVYGLARNTQNAIKRIEKLGAKYEKGLLTEIPDSDNFNRILISFKNKLENMKKENYHVFKKNYLLIHSSIYATSEMINNAIIAMCEMQENEKYLFQKVYIVVPYFLYVCDLTCKSSYTIDIKDLQYDFAISARKMVEDIERTNV